MPPPPSIPSWDEVTLEKIRAPFKEQAVGFATDKEVDGYGLPGNVAYAVEVRACFAHAQLNRVLASSACSVGGPAYKRAQLVGKALQRVEDWWRELPSEDRNAVPAMGVYIFFAGVDDQLDKCNEALFKAAGDAASQLWLKVAHTIIKSCPKKPSSSDRAVACDPNIFSSGLVNIPLPCTLSKGKCKGAPTLLGLATLCGDLATARSLLVAGADPGAPSDVAGEGLKPLGIAAKTGNCDLLALLLEYGETSAPSSFSPTPSFSPSSPTPRDTPFVDERCRQGCTALALSCEPNKSKSCEPNATAAAVFLLTHGADAAIANGRGELPWHLACGSGDLAVAKALRLTSTKRARAKVSESKTGDKPDTVRLAILRAGTAILGAVEAEAPSRASGCTCLEYAVGLPTTWTGPGLAGPNATVASALPAEGSLTAAQERRGLEEEKEEEERTAAAITMVRFLLDTADKKDGVGADPNYSVLHGQPGPCLGAAVAKGSLRLVEVLLIAGARVPWGGEVREAALEQHVKQLSARLEGEALVGGALEGEAARVQSFARESPLTFARAKVKALEKKRSGDVKQVRWAAIVKALEAALAKQKQQRERSAVDSGGGGGGGCVQEPSPASAGTPKPPPSPSKKKKHNVASPAASAAAAPSCDADFALKTGSGLSGGGQGGMRRVAIGKTMLYSDLCPSFAHRLAWEKRRVSENPDGVVAERVPCGKCGLGLSRGKQQKCGGCKLAIYCGSACQAQAWKDGHKSVCKSAGYLLRVRKNPVVRAMADRAKKGRYPWRLPAGLSAAFGQCVFSSHLEMSDEVLLKSLAHAQVNGGGKGRGSAASADGGDSEEDGDDEEEGDSGSAGLSLSKIPVADVLARLSEARIPKWLAHACSEYFASPERWHNAPVEGGRLRPTCGKNKFDAGSANHAFLKARGLEMQGNACKGTSTLLASKLSASARKKLVPLPCGTRSWLGGSLNYVSTAPPPTMASAAAAAFQNDGTTEAAHFAASVLKTKDHRHPTVKVKFGALVDAEVQCPKCPKNGSLGESVGTFVHSFCTGKAEVVTSSPGSVKHCAACGACRDYMYYHCLLGCGKCSYPRSVPCRWCHLLVLGSDGVRFLPLVKARCEAGDCACGKGEAVWRGSMHSGSGAVDMAAELERQSVEKGLPVMPRELIRASLAAKGF